MDLCGCCFIRTGIASAPHPICRRDPGTCLLPKTCSRIAKQAGPEVQADASFLVRAKSKDALNQRENSSRSIDFLYFNPISTTLFCQVECLVCPLNDIDRIFVCITQFRDTDTDTQANMLAV